MFDKTVLLCITSKLQDNNNDKHTIKFNKTRARLHDTDTTLVTQVLNYRLFAIQIFTEIPVRLDKARYSGHAKTQETAPIYKLKVREVHIILA